MLKSNPQGNSQGKSEEQFVRIILKKVPKTNSQGKCLRKIQKRIINGKAWEKSLGEFLRKILRSMLNNPEEKSKGKSLSKMLKENPKFESFRESVGKNP